MQADSPNNSIANTFSKPTHYSQWNHCTAVAHADQIIVLFDPEFKIYSFKDSQFQGKTWSLKMKDNILVRGSSQGIVDLWDIREFGSVKKIHSFNRPGHKINAIDLSQHILAAGTSKGVTFWDLRKMKQRCEFNDSFNDEVSGLQFSNEEPTMFHACAMDGLIVEFNLKEQNEEDACQWGHQIIESPSKLQLLGRTTLIQTQNQILLTLQEASLDQRYEINNVQNPTHILNSFLEVDRSIHYYTKTMKTGAVQYWIGGYNVGYVPTKVEVEMLIPIKQNKVLFADENGQWFFEEVVSGVAHKSKPKNDNFMTVEELSEKMNVKTSEKAVNENGFILQKPSSLKSHSKKFKPF